MEKWKDHQKSAVLFASASTAGDHFTKFEFLAKFDATYNNISNNVSDNISNNMLTIISNN